MTATTRARRPRRALATLIACAALASAPVSLTFAAGPPDANNIALINGSATGAITIHKYAGAPVDCANNGTDQSACTALSGLTGLAGAEFTITRVEGVDLTTNAGWQAAAGYRDSSLSTKPPLSTDGAEIATVTTTSGGTATTEDLPLGLYYVEETKPPTTAGTTYSPVAPFLVTLPMTHPTDLNQWMYTVHVYPKNTAETITKTVADRWTQTTDVVGGGITTGSARADGVTYTIETSVPVTARDAAELGRYEIHDHFDARVLYQGLTSVVLTKTDETDVTLTRCTTESATACDYRVHVNGNLAGSNTADTAGAARVRVEFTERGRTQLTGGTFDATTFPRRVDWSVRTTLTADLGANDTDGTLTNKAYLVPNAAWVAANSGSTDPGIPSPEVESKYGDIRFLKFDAADVDGANPDGDNTNMTGLAGAQFNVYKGALGATSCTSSVVVADNLIAGPFTTDANGFLDVKGLQRSDFYNGASVAHSAQQLTYCLVETKAPTGYNLSAKPYAFRITWSGTPTFAAAPGAWTTAGVYASGVNYLPLPNEKSNLANSLPLTGGNGVSMLSGLAVLLGVGGLSYYAISSRRHRDEERV